MDLAELEVLPLAQTRSLAAAIFLSKTYRLVTWAAFHHHGTDAAGGAAILMVETQWEFHQRWALQVHQTAAGASSSGGSAMVTGLLLVRRMRAGSCRLWPQTSLAVISPNAVRTMAAAHSGVPRSMAQALLIHATVGPCPFGGAAQPAAQAATLAIDRQVGNGL